MGGWGVVCVRSQGGRVWGVDFAYRCMSMGWTARDRQVRISVHPMYVRMYVCMYQHRSTNIHTRGCQGNPVLPRRRRKPLHEQAPRALGDVLGVVFCIVLKGGKGHSFGGSAGAVLIRS